MVATSFPCQPRWGATMALAGAFLWGRAALLPSCYFVSRTVDYTNYGSMSVIGILRQLTVGVYSNQKQDTVIGDSAMAHSLLSGERSRGSWLWILCVTFVVACNFKLHAQGFNPRNLPRDWASRPILKQRLISLAGEGARNCGHASFSTIDASDVTSCALQSYSSKTKFYVQYDVQGIDSELGIGFAFDGKKVYAVAWERLQQYWRRQEIIDVEVCPSPTTLFRTGTGKLNCFSLEAKPKRNILSPELDFY